MSRKLVIGAAQMGPIARADSRAAVVDRQLALLEKAHARGCGLVVYPELCLTTFFPRFDLHDRSEMDVFFEAEMPGPDTKRLFDAAKKMKIAFYYGYAEKIVVDGATHYYNTAILVGPDGQQIGKYRKVHLPGHAETDPKKKVHNFEKRYFEVGNLGFPVWRALGGVVGMAVCNDRRWPETYRVMGLKGVELVLIGYNTGAGNYWGNEAPYLRMFHNSLSLQSGAYQNGTWVVGVAKAGVEEGVAMIGGSMIVAPSGEIVAQAHTLGDELVVSECDLDECVFAKSTTFDFARHRRPEHYGIIASQAGPTPPPEG